MENIIGRARKLINSPSISLEDKNTIKDLLKTKIDFDKNNRGNENYEVIPNLDSLKFKNDFNKVSDHDFVDENSIRDELRDYLMKSHSSTLMDIDCSNEARRIIEHEIEMFCNERRYLIKGKTQIETLKYLVDDILDYSVLTDFILDHGNNGFEEIRVNDFNDIRIVIRGREEKSNLSFESTSHLFSVAQKMCRNNGHRVINKDNPFVRMRLGNDIRVTMMSSPVARRSNENSLVVHMVIRKQSKSPFTKEFLIETQTICDCGYEFLKTLIKYGASVNFYGGTNSGKTAAISTFANDVFSISDTRVITIAEVDELNLRADDEVTGTARSNTLMWELKDDFDYRKAVNSALTFTPQTLILQETKGAEIVDVIDASITGHQVLTSSHAKNINVFAKRMLGMFKMSGSDISDDLILEYIAEAFDVIVKLKIYSDGKRRISQISELSNYDRSSGRFTVNNMYEFRYDGVSGRHEFLSLFSDDLRNEMIENGISENELKGISSYFGNVGGL